MSQQKIVIPISPRHSKTTRLAIAKEVIDHIIERTREKNLDKKGKPFPEYSKSYTSDKPSSQFKIAGKNKNRVDLTLTGEMMDSLKMLSVKNKGEIEIGYDRGDKELNGKVEGNILGTYGRDKPIRGKKRDFLGIQKTELKKIEEKYLDEESREEKLAELDLIGKKVDEIVGGRIIFEGEDE